MMKSKISRCILRVFCSTLLVSATVTVEAQSSRRGAPARKAVTKKPAPKKAAPRKAVTANASPKRAVALSGYQTQSRQRAIEWVKQAAVTFEKGDYARTIQLCKAANDAYPTYARAYTWIGASYQKLGKKDEACDAFKWVKALAPNTPDAQRAERGLREMGYYNRW